MKVREAYLKYRATDVEIPNRELTTPEDVYRAYKYLNDLPIEVVMAVFVSARNRVLCQSTIQTGTVDHSVVYPREILQRALLLHASGFILIHNHPSGDSTPSTQDINLTSNLAIAAKAMGIRFLDHVIVGDQVFHSFQRDGLIS